MTKPLIDRKKMDHPEHFDDIIREYKSSNRYIPTPLENLLFEMAGHRCTICKEPWLEIHHIKPLEKGGKTSYENLIVLCPNCHTRVHKENIPSNTELIHYKIKQEISFNLPVISKIQKEEIELLKENYSKKFEELQAYLKRELFEINKNEVNVSIEAKILARKKYGYKYLELCGILNLSIENFHITADKNYKYAYEVRFTHLGIKWIEYLKESGKISLIITQSDA